MFAQLAYAGNCFGMGTFLKGHGDVLRSNRCIIGLDHVRNTVGGLDATEKHWSKASSPPNVGRFYGDCADSHLTMASNEYYTPDGVVNIGCNGDIFHTLKEMQDLFGLETGSVGGKIPDDATILKWAARIMCYPSLC